MFGGEMETEAGTDGSDSATKGDTAPDSSDASSSTTDGSSTTDPSTTATDETTDGSSSGSTGGEPVCGDGMLEGDEQCEVGDEGCTDLCLPQGSRVWLTLLDDVLDDEGARGQDLLVTADDTLFVAAHQLAYQANVQAVVAELDTDGVVVATEPLPGDAHNRLALAELGGNLHLLAADGFSPWLAQLDGTGSPVWRTDWANPDSFEAHDAASDGNFVYVYLLDAVQGVGLVPTLRAVNESGTEQWDLQFSGHYVRPMVAATSDGVVVQHGVGTPEADTGRETCRVPSTGTMPTCWTFDLSAEVHGMHVDNGTVYVAAGEVSNGLSTWIVAAFDSDGDEMWSTRVFEDADTDRDHQPNALTTTADGRLIVGGSALTPGGDIAAAWATLDSSTGIAGPTWTDDELGPVQNVEQLGDGTLVSSGSMPLGQFPKPLFVTKQLL